MALTSFQRLRELARIRKPQNTPKKGAGADTTAPTRGYRYTACTTHCCWPWGGVVIRTAAHKACLAWMELPLPLASAGAGHVLPLSVYLARDWFQVGSDCPGLMLLCKGCWEHVYPARLASVMGGWLCLVTWRAPEAGRELGCQTHDRRPLQSLRWPSRACHQLTLAGAVWEIQSAFASGKDFTNSLR